MASGSVIGRTNGFRDIRVSKSTLVCISNAVEIGRCGR